jgi:ribosome biogenesis GTPase A
MKANQELRDNAANWLKKLGKELPTVIFGNPTSEEDKNNECEELVKKIIQVFTKGKGKEPIINVGLIGIPNVGKSAIISTMKSYLKKNPIPNIKIAETPGVILAENSPNSLMLRHVKKPEDIADPFINVHA